MLYLFALANGHKTRHDRRESLQLSDFVSFDNGHLHFYPFRILAAASILVIVGLGIFGLIRPDIANKPIPGRYVLVIGIIVAVIVACMFYARIREGSTVDM